MKAILKPIKNMFYHYSWSCPSCDSGSFTYSEQINARWGHPADKVFCAVCRKYFDIEIKN